MTDTDMLHMAALEKENVDGRRCLLIDIDEPTIGINGFAVTLK